VSVTGFGIPPAYASSPPGQRPSFSTLPSLHAEWGSSYPPLLCASGKVWSLSSLLSMLTHFGFPAVSVTGFGIPPARLRAHPVVNGHHFHRCHLFMPSGVHPTRRSCPRLWSSVVIVLVAVYADSYRLSSCVSDWFRHPACTPAGSHRGQRPTFSPLSSVHAEWGSSYPPLLWSLSSLLSMLTHFSQ
jgi:hypothetical protein